MQVPTNELQTGPNVDRPVFGGLHWLDHLGMDEGRSLTVSFTPSSVGLYRGVAAAPGLGSDALPAAERPIE
ncbi:hypothetical protein ANOBCDAF_02404 [Pleomorphomonas sp. T1.2MG-36]|nr:hypothetical protein ANOBCDAF_02404 [Pleomorphomonas sp. T1.2MG-36]